jgi:formate dehydrogenase subunit gamma
MRLGPRGAGVARLFFKMILREDPAAQPHVQSTTESKPMKTAFTFLRAGALALLVAFAAAQLGASSPASAQQAPNPTAQSVKEEQLLNALKPGSAVSGRITIPDQHASTLIQPQGQTWRAFHQSTLPTIGAVAVLGMLILLAIFYLVRGRVTIDGGFSGRTVTRFGGFDRFVHWVTASTFIVLALSGLNLTFGKSIVAPLFGDAAFASLAAYGKIAHNYLAFPFMAGVALMFIIWVKDNVPNKLDLEWIKAGGGLFVKGAHPPAKRFNAGQKGVFWVVIAGGVVMSVSGWHLLFPFSDGHFVSEQQFWLNIHGVLSMVFIAIMLAHAYIGSVGMEGAFDAMGTGEVDENWAKEHHSLWLEEQKRAAGKASPAAVPAE